MDESKYIKSHSNYVLKKKHQEINGGTISERDITTINGLNQFSPGQVPIYKSSNFIITVNNEASFSKTIKEEEFDEWTLDEIENLPKISNKYDDSLDIVLKQEFYRLRDFAYFGSCSELIRVSILDIIDKFPGELYVPSINGEGINVYYHKIDDQIVLGGKDLILVDNPFNINIHTPYMNKKDITNPLKYMCNNGFKNYCDGINDNNEIEWETTCETDCVSKGGKLATITINKAIKIYAYLGDEGKIYYLVNKNDVNVDTVIARPKSKFINDFFKNLDSFQKILLNRDSIPKYTATLEVLSESKYGYKSELVQFTFPTTYGEYNLATYGVAYENYIKNFSRYTSYYDDLFCDNLYRSMTHEAIKNFDWTRTRRYDKEDEKEFTLGGNKLKKLIRIIGREFDEIKLYIDGIKDYNNIAYGENSLTPDYFLSSHLTNKGWIINPITNDNNDYETVSPYSKNNLTEDEKNGYFTINIKNKIISKNNNVRLFDETTNQLLNRIKTYSNEKEFIFKDINTYFLKMLNINSKSILRKRGTIEGLESLLSLFGLKNKRMCKNSNEVNSGKYDYEIKEFIAITDIKEDTINSGYNMPMINWYNSTKTIVYNTQEFRNGIYMPYQGLPIRGYVKRNGRLNNIDIFKSDFELQSYLNNIKDTQDKKVFLYPYFSCNKILDGNPFYQMKGGWMKKNNSYYSETYRTIKSTPNLQSLLSIPISDLIDGEVYEVKDISGKYIIVDGLTYKVIDNAYIEITIYGNLLRLGYTTFENVITISSSDGSNKDINLNQLEDGYNLKIYINNNTIVCYGKYYSISVPTIVNYENNTKNYFKLKNKKYKNEISDKGWLLLDNNSEEFLHLNSIQDTLIGNNPHKGNLSYDNGEDYINMFKKLFKYPLENNLFDKDKYSNFDDVYDIINGIGFRFNSGNTDSCMDYEISDEKVKDFTMLSNNSYNIPSEYENKITVTDGITDQIVNTKRVDIVFNIKDENEVIFIEKVIIPYLEQVIPSTLIINIYYDGNEINRNVNIDNYDLEFDVNPINACNINESNIVNNIRLVDKYSGEIIKDKYNYDINFSRPIEDNNTNNLIEHEVTVRTINGKKSKTKKFLQKEGPCTPSTTEDTYEIVCIPNGNITIDKCEKYNDINVKIIGKKNGIIDESFNESSYNITFDSFFDENDTTESIEHTMTINILHKNYLNKGPITKTITQQAGPCNINESYDFSNAVLEVIAPTMEACESEPHLEVRITNISQTNYINTKNDISMILKDYEYSINMIEGGNFRVNENKDKRTYIFNVETNKKYGNNKLYAMGVTLEQNGGCSYTCSEEIFYDKATISYKTYTIGKCCEKKESFLYDVEAVIPHRLENCSYQDDIIVIDKNDYEIILLNEITENNTIYPKQIEFKLKYKLPNNKEYTVENLYATQEAGPCKEGACDCKVNSITVYPNYYEFIRGEETEKIFKVSLNTNGKNCCNENFNVYEKESKNVICENAIKEFTINTTASTFVIESCQDKSKTCELVTNIVDGKCTCNVEKISIVSPIMTPNINEDGIEEYSYSFKEGEDKANFNISIKSNNAKCCSNKFSVFKGYEFLGEFENSFSLKPINGKFEIISEDNKNKSCILIVSAPCEEEFDTTNAKFEIGEYTWEACSKTPSLPNFCLAHIKHKSSDCQIDNDWSLKLELNKNYIFLEEEDPNDSYSKNFDKEDVTKLIPLRITNLKINDEDFSGDYNFELIQKGGCDECSFVRWNLKGSNTSANFCHRTCYVDVTAIYEQGGVELEANPSSYTIDGSSGSWSGGISGSRGEATYNTQGSGGKCNFNLKFNVCGSQKTYTALFTCSESCCWNYEKVLDGCYSGHNGKQMFVEVEAAYTDKYGNKQTISASDYRMRDDGGGASWSVSRSGNRYNVSASGPNSRGTLILTYNYCGETYETQHVFWTDK